MYRLHPSGSDGLRGAGSPTYQTYCWLEHVVTAVSEVSQRQLKEATPQQLAWA